MYISKLYMLCIMNLPAEELMESGLKIMDVIFNRINSHLNY